MAENLQNKLLSLFLSSGDDSEEVAALKRALAAAIRQSELPRTPPPLDFEKQCELLAKSYEQLKIPHKFIPGQIVRWKPGLRNRFIPIDGQPGIVLEVLDKPIFDGCQDASQVLFREPLDVRIGLLGPFNDLIPYWYDSRRFEPI